MRYQPTKGVAQWHKWIERNKDAVQLMRVLDLTGRRFGRLVALRVVHAEGRRCWEGQCDCGNTVIVPTAQLINGIDRRDNTAGYVPENVVTCCAACNYKKGAQPYAAFLDWLRTVALYRGVGGRPPRDALIRLPPCPACAARLYCTADLTQMRCLSCGWQVQLDPAVAQDVGDALHGISDLALDVLLRLLPTTPI